MKSGRNEASPFYDKRLRSVRKIGQRTHRWVLSSRLTKHGPIGYRGTCRYLTHFDDHVGRYIQAACGLANRLGVVCFVQAIGLSLVGAEKRKEPVNAHVGVDLLDCGGNLRRRLNLLREIPLDQIKR